MNEKLSIVRRLVVSNSPRNIEKRKACSTEHELKIWFTHLNSDEPLGGIINELRLIRERETFPKHDVRLIYHPDNLTEIGKKKLNQFCQLHDIELFSLDNIKDELTTLLNDGVLTKESVNIQLQLLEIAKKECQAPFGNLAAASDIVRLLTPALQVRPSNAEKHDGSRIYTDFDSPLSSMLPSIIELEKDELLTAENSNNFIFASSFENQVLQIARKRILSNYQPENFHMILKNAYELACVEGISKNVFDYKHPPFMKSTLKDIQEILNNVQNKSSDQYMIEDLYTLRRAILDIKSNSDNKQFWDIFYIKLTVLMSGPIVFNSIADDDMSAAPEMEPMTFLAEPTSASDLSWLPDSTYQIETAKKENILQNGAQKIITFFKNRKNTSQEDQDVKPNTKIKPS